MTKNNKFMDGLKGILKIIFLLPSMLGGLLAPLVLAYFGYQWLFHDRYVEYIPWLILFYSHATLITSFTAKKYYKIGVYAEFVEGHFNWVYILSLPMTLYMLYAMIFEDATWANLIYVLAVGFVSKWIAIFHRHLGIANYQTLVKLGIEHPSQTKDLES